MDCSDGDELKDGTEAALQVSVFRTDWKRKLQTQRAPHYFRSFISVSRVHEQKALQIKHRLYSDVDSVWGLQPVS